MKYRLLYTIFFYLLLYSVSNGQVDSIYYNVKVTLKNWEVIKAKEVRYNEKNNFIHFPQKDHTHINYNLKEVYTIEHKKGSHTLLYSFCGLAAGSLVFYGIYKVNDWDDPFNDVSSSKISSTFFACAGLGVGIGFIIGRTKGKYKLIYQNGKFVYY